MCNIDLWSLAWAVLFICITYYSVAELKNPKDD